MQTHEIQGRAPIDYEKIKLVHVHECAQVDVREVTLLDGSNWMCHALNCAAVQVQGLKILSPTKGRYNDGFDVNGCASYENRNSFVWSEDDAVAIMSRERTTGSVRFVDLLAVTNCSGIRLGWNSNFPIQEVTFERCEWIRADLQTFAFHELRNQATFGTLAFIDCRFHRDALVHVFSIFNDDFGRGTPRIGKMIYRDCRFAKPQPPAFPRSKGCQIGEVEVTRTLFQEPTPVR